MKNVIYKNNCYYLMNDNINYCAPNNICFRYNFSYDNNIISLDDEREIVYTVYIEKKIANFDEDNNLLCKKMFNKQPRNNGTMSTSYNDKEENECIFIKSKKSYKEYFSNITEDDLENIIFLSLENGCISSINEEKGIVTNQGYEFKKGTEYEIVVSESKFIKKFINGLFKYNPKLFKEEKSSYDLIDVLRLFKSRKNNKFFSKFDYSNFEEAEFLNIFSKDWPCNGFDEKLFPRVIDGKNILYLGYSTPGRDYGDYLYSDDNINKLVNKIVNDLLDKGINEWELKENGHYPTIYNNDKLQSLANDYDFIFDMSYGPM